MHVRHCVLWILEREGMKNCQANDISEALC